MKWNRKCHDERWIMYKYVQYTDMYNTMQFTNPKLGNIGQNLFKK